MENHKEELSFADLQDFPLEMQQIADDETNNEEGTCGTVSSSEIKDISFSSKVQKFVEKVVAGCVWHLFNPNILPHFQTNL